MTLQVVRGVFLSLTQTKGDHNFSIRLRGHRQHYTIGKALMPGPGATWRQALRTDVQSWVYGVEVDIMVEMHIDVERAEYAVEAYFWEAAMPRTPPPLEDFPQSGVAV